MAHGPLDQNIGFNGAFLPTILHFCYHLFIHITAKNYIKKLQIMCHLNLEQKRLVKKKLLSVPIYID